jgi:hypothetical protein
MKPTPISCLLFGAIIASPCHAIESIGWNYDGVGDDTLEVGDVAGFQAYAQSNWNNHRGSGQGPGAVPFALVDRHGEDSGVSISAWTMSHDNSWHHGQSGDPDEKLLNSFANRQPVITFSNIPENYQQSGYSIVVYYGNNEGPSSSLLSVSGSVDDLQQRDIQTGNTAQSSYGAHGYLEETGDLAGSTNFTVFRGFNDPNVTVTLSGLNNNGISAIQIVQEFGAPSAPEVQAPYDGEGDVGISANLVWNPSLRATHYDVYLWKTSGGGAAAAAATVTSASYDPPGDLDPLEDYSWKVIAVGEGGSAEGPTWSFTTGTAEVPGQVEFPFPSDNSSGILPGVTLEWAPAVRASAYDLYLWETSGTRPDSPTLTLDRISYKPVVSLKGGVQYSWQVVAKNSLGETEGPIWSFTIGAAPALLTSPIPADGALGLNRQVLLDWEDSTGATSYQVYYWVDGDEVPSEPLATLTTSSLALPRVLDAGTGYRWRVDTVNEFATTTGSVWSFSTSDKITNQQSIGWSYDGIGDDTLDAAEVAGIPVFRQSNWNNHSGVDANREEYGQGPGALPFPLFDNHGISTGTNVTAWEQVVVNSWFYDQSANPDEKLLDAFTCTQPSITFTGIPDDYRSIGYSVVVYYGNNEGPATSTIQLTGSNDDSMAKTIITGNQANSYRKLGYVQETGTLEGTSNHVVFNGLDDPSITISMTGANNNGISAIQIIKTGAKAPVAVDSPIPADQATGIERQLTLNWSDSPSAGAYRLYLWAAGDDVPLQPVATVAISESSVPYVLEPNTTYHWRIDVANDTGNNTGAVWSFTTSDVVTSQQSIGWNYDGLGDDTLESNAVAGAPGYHQSNWTNHVGIGQGAGETPYALMDNLGNSTSLMVSEWSQVTGNSWYQNTQSPALNANEKLMNSFAATQVSLTFSGVPADYMEIGYTVVVYYGNNEGPATSTLSITGSDDDQRSRQVITGNTARSAYRSVGFVRETGALAGPTNYTVFQGLNDPSFTLAFSGTNNNGICGVQVIKSAAVDEEGYEIWAVSRGLSGEDAEFSADPDHDGISNGIEFVIGGEPNPENPGANSTHLMPRFEVLDGNAIFIFHRAAQAAFLEPYVEFNSGLDGDWIRAASPANATITTVPSAGGDTVTVTIPMRDRSSIFARLRVNLP